MINDSEREQKEVWFIQTEGSFTEHWIRFSEMVCENILLDGSLNLYCNNAPAR